MPLTLVAADCGPSLALSQSPSCPLVEQGGREEREMKPSDGLVYPFRM